MCVYMCMYLASGTVLVGGKYELFRTEMNMLRFKVNWINPGFFAQFYRDITDL